MDNKFTRWEWDKSLETGIEEIDLQHRQIVDYINRLRQAIRKDDAAATAEVLELLVVYTLTHFSFEEDLMAKAGYPCLETHRRVHDNFRRTVEEYRKRDAAGEDVARQLHSDLCVWLMNHIKRDDRDYASSVKSVLKQNWMRKAVSRYFGQQAS